MFYTVGYKASLSTPVPGSIIRQLLAICSKYRRWSLAWQTGFIIQEGIVEILVTVQEDKGGKRYLTVLSCPEFVLSTHLNFCLDVLLGQVDQKLGPQFKPLIYYLSNVELTCINVYKVG